MAVTARIFGWSRAGKIAALCIGVCSAVALAACGKIESTTLEQAPFQSVPTLSQFEVFGTVTSGGSPVEGVFVSGNGGESTTSTDAVGVYRLSLPTGEHTLDFSKDGHPSVTKVVTGNALTEVQLDVALDAGGGDGGGRTRGESFTVKPGVRLERRVTGPGRLEFDITGMNNPNPELKQHIAWGYEPGHGFSGGRGSGGAEWGLRTYKIKVFGVGGDFASEPRYSVTWRRGRTYHVVIEWNTRAVSVDIDGERAGVGTRLPNTWIVGIGWPPAARDGINGATYSNIVWPAGSEPR